MLGWVALQPWILKVSARLRVEQHDHREVLTEEDG